MSTSEIRRKVLVAVLVAAVGTIFTVVTQRFIDSLPWTEDYQGLVDEPPGLPMTKPLPQLTDSPPEPPPETRERSFNVNFWNDHCRGPQNINWRINADEGWRTLGRLVNGGGGCGPFGLWRDSSGHMRIVGTYVEEQIVD